MEFERIKKSLLIPSFLYNTNTSNKNDGFYYVRSGLCGGLNFALGSRTFTLLENAAKIRLWQPTSMLGVTARGACMLGSYEFFKKYYSDLAGPENADKYKTTIYLASSAHAIVIADVVQYPFINARLYNYVQQRRNVLPFLMICFTSFETTVELLYKHAISKPKSECSTPLQLGVSFAGGYGAGTLCAYVVSPIDNLTSYLRHVKGSTICDAVNKVGLWTFFSHQLPARTVGLGIFAGVQWGLYDAFRVLVGLPTTGGAAPVQLAKG